MKEQFQHKFTTSFAMWFDNFLLKKGEAFSNKTGTFYYYEDGRLDSSYKVFGSPYKQFVNDSSISGAVIRTGIPDIGDAVLDYENGRIIDTGSQFETGDLITGEFAVKDFNIYLTNDTEDDLIIENKYTVNSRLPSGPLTYIQPYDDVVPAIFLSILEVENRGFALGGMQDTVVQANAVVIAEDTYQLDGVLSIFADSVTETFAPIPMSGYPVTELGDLKDGSYNYTGTAAEFNDTVEFFIDKVRTSKLSDRVRRELASELYIGFIDFDIQQHRYRFQ